MTEPYALAERFKHMFVVGPDCLRPNQDENRQTSTTNLSQPLRHLARVGRRRERHFTPFEHGRVPYPHREGARLTLETLLGLLDGEEDPGIKTFTIVVKKRISFQTCGRFIEKSMTCCLVLIQQMTEVYP